MQSWYWVRQFFRVEENNPERHCTAFNRVTGEQLGSWPEGGIYPTIVFDSYLAYCIKE
jgi:hypothetical protein